MIQKIQILLLATILLNAINTTECVGQTYNLIQTFENGGTGSDGCWSGYNHTSVPTTSDFFTNSSVVQSGQYSGGMFSCCGGPSTNDPTYYISPVLISDTHTVIIYLRQSSFFNEDFEIGSVSDSLGTNFTLSYTKSIWPSTPAWELTSTFVSTSSTNNRIAFRVPPASLKTYYLDSLVIGNSGNNIGGCNYVTITSINDLDKNENLTAAYPSPFNNELKINSSSQRNGDIVLRDVTGKEILRQKTFVGETVINTNSVSNGFYLLYYTDGSTVNIFKMIKQ